MLVLTRKLKEQIVIGDGDLTITVLGLGTGRVRLGIDVPSDVAIRRRELIDDHGQPVSISHDLEWATNQTAH